MLPPGLARDPEPDASFSLALKSKKRLTAADVRRLAESNRVRGGETQERADRGLAQELGALEAECEFTPAAAALFQQLLARLGVALAKPIALPLDRQAYWLRSGHPLANYQSQSGPP